MTTTPTTRVPMRLSAPPLSHDAPLIARDLQPLVNPILLTAFHDIHDHAHAQLPNEAIGIISISGRVYRLTNIHAYPLHYSFAPRLYVQLAHSDLLKANDPASITYHTHPRGPATPSADDEATFRERHPNIFAIYSYPTRILTAYTYDAETSQVVQVGQVRKVPA